MPKRCETCLREYDGRRRNCPYCKDDDEYLQVQSSRVSSRRNEMGTRAGTLGLSGSVMGDLDRDINELDDVSDLITEFRALSVHLNARMDAIEGLVSEITQRLPTVPDVQNGVVDAGGDAGDVEQEEGESADASLGATGGGTGDKSSVKEVVKKFNFVNFESLWTPI